GSSTVEFVAPPPKFHANVSGRLLFGSLPVPVKLTLWPAAIVTFAVGVSMTPFGAWFAVAVTVTVRVAGVGSARPSASVTVNVTVNVPAVLNTTAPGSSTVEFVAPPPMFHANVSGRLLFGSEPVPVKLTLWPAMIVTFAVGVSITSFGAWFGAAFTVMVRVSGVGSEAPRASATVNVTVYVPAVLNTTAPGSSTELLAAPPPKFHANVSGRLLFGSVPVPVKLTLCPAVIVTLAAGVLMTPFGAAFGVTVT